MKKYSLADIDGIESFETPEALSDLLAHVSLNELQQFSDLIGGTLDFTERGIEKTKLLLKKGYDINSDPGTLHGAIGGLYMYMIDVVGSEGHGPENMTDIVFLVENGVELNNLDINGDTPLDTAIEYGFQDIPRYLRQHGAKRAHELSGSVASDQKQDGIETEKNNF